ncbi:MAG TPA: PQQ-dependent sugar dehydrogenase, partial [Anaerolineae bacterium]|nr:PQQ-dependent sugar dehydrogenase [Anaerolineae bacterium]
LILSFTACSTSSGSSSQANAPANSPTQSQSATLAPATETHASPATPPATQTQAQAAVPTPTQAVAPTQTQLPALPEPTLAPKSTSASPSDASFTLGVEPLVQGLTRPVFVTSAGDNSGLLFVVQQTGQILIIENGQLRQQPFLDIRNKITTAGNEQGLLGMAFDPHYDKTGVFYVNYSRKENGDNVIARYQLSRDPYVADPNSEKVLLTIKGFEPNHNSGMLAFGPDGYLYIGTGDGGGAGDRHGTIGNAQALNILNGKILRIDVNADTYSIPPTNPFVNQPDALPEIWVYGLRNPWRFSFDKETGDLYIGDVGQGSKEEVDFQPAGDKGGENYGWRVMEGNDCYNPNTNCDTSGKVRPIFDYSHDFGCSITGGYVYRGSRYPWLVGQYIFADYCSGIVWTTSRDASGQWQTRQIGKFDDTISSFGQDQDGELYVVGHSSGTIYKLTSQHG